jgi:hypothetical protein
MTTMAQVTANRAKLGMLPPPTPNAAGAYGYDPITQAPITDQNAAMRFNDPGTQQPLASYMAPAPAMMPQRATGIPGGGGGGGRMGPQQPRRKIMTLGPRTAAEYTAERGSTLDNAYATGNLTNPNPTAAAPAPVPAGTMTSPFNPFSAGQDAGAEVGAQFGQMLNQAAKPKMMAKGGPMKMGTKPYLVGEEGPELIMPRQNGEGFVLPADVTAQVLPAMRDVTPKSKGGQMNYTPRAEGGPMIMQGPVVDPRAPVMRSETGQFGVLNSPYGIGYADTSSMPVPLPGPQGISDERGMIAMNSNRQQMHNQVSQPMSMDPLQYQPDPLAGTPWGAPAGAPNVAMGLDRRPLTDAIASQNAIINNTQTMLPAASFDMVNDGVTKQNIPMADMQQRVAVRGLMYGDDYRDRQARNQTQLDLAARANRAPLGSAPAPASQIPGMPAMRPSTQRAIDRNQERFLRTPEGAQFALGNAQRQAELQQRTQLASTAIPVLGPNGETLGYTTGTGASLPNINRARTVQRTAEIDGQYYNFFDDGTAEPIANVPRSPGKQFALNPLGEIKELPPGITADQLPAGFTLLGPKSTPEIGGSKIDPLTPGSGPVKVNSPEEARALKPGTKFITSDGRTGTR